MPAASRPATIVSLRVMVGSRGATRGCDFVAEAEGHVDRAVEIGDRRDGAERRRRQAQQAGRGDAALGRAVERIRAAIGQRAFGGVDRARGRNRRAEQPKRALAAAAIDRHQVERQLGVRRQRLVAAQPERVGQHKADACGWHPAPRPRRCRALRAHRPEICGCRCARPCRAPAAVRPARFRGSPLSAPHRACRPARPENARSAATFCKRPAIVPSPPAGKIGHSETPALAATAKSLAITGDTTSDSPAALDTTCPACASAWLPFASSVRSSLW